MSEMSRRSRVESRAAKSASDAQAERRTNDPVKDAGEPIRANAGVGGIRSTPAADSVQATCTAGMTRSCCSSGVQTCTNDEFALWGPCLDRDGMPLKCDECTGSSCDTAEHHDAGEPPDAGQRDAGRERVDDASVPLDAGQCGPGMVCKPGSLRYCDDSSIAEWTVSTCTAAGQWDPCVATTIPPELDGVGDCTATSFSPESCCSQKHICCQEDEFGLLDAWGSDSCAGLNCP